MVLSVGQMEKFILVVSSMAWRREEESSFGSTVQSMWESLLKEKSKV